VAAAADSPRIDEVIHAASRLWVREWLPEIPGDLSALGLDPPRLEVTLALSRDAAAAAPVSFALSDRHALQAEDVVYARRSGDGQIGLVNASALQEFTPQMAAWRDLRLLQFDPALVDTVTITRPDAALRLTREAGGWSFGVTGEQADERAVMDLIKSLAALRAVSFSGELELASAGLTPPAATVTVTPAVQPAAMLQIGAPTDSAGGRLRYVQTGQSGEIAKVRSGDVEILLGDLDVFIDRTILNCNPARIAKLELERRGPAAARPQRLVFERDAQQVWQVTAPAGQQVELAQINQLVAALADLRGEPVAGAAPDTANHPDPPAHSANAEQSAGADDGAGPCRALQDPDVHLRLHLAALPVVRAGGAATEGAAPEAAEPEILELQAVRQGDRAYVRRGGETRCFEVPAAVHDKLMAELLDGGIWNFDPRRVRSFTWTGPEGTLRFQREDGRWTFTPEPDLPLDDKKVLAHLEQIRGLRTPRYAAFDAAGDSDPEFGLDRPAHLLQFELDDGTAQELRISGVQPPDSDRHFYATIAGDNVVFLLAQASIERLAPRLDALEAR
jgi:hypothetical protein